MVDLVWLVPFLPLIGGAVLMAFGSRIGEPRAGWLATFATATSFLVTVAVYFDLLGMPSEERSHVVTLFQWIPVGALQIDFALLADPLSITMALFVTGIGSLIHLYAIGYMHGDPKFPKFFLYLNLFVFSMLMLVLGENLLVTFLGWEGVGACSYFLISFWHTRNSAAVAGKKAFVTNRIGDWGVMTAMFVAFSAVGSVSYKAINEAAHEGTISQTAISAIAILLFVGACGKSAQLPLYFWLPDAMEGPTPVSALIHAATMVTAGVFLMTRVGPVLAESYGWVPDTIAIVGAATALFAASIAVAQHDIKRVLAYSTVSQLGFMFLAIGSGAYVAAIFHMVTHAFFKALLFLGSGSVIHGMHHEQDMRKMGALRIAMPVTAITFIIGWLAIAGVPPFAGFWSKDEILLYVYADNRLLYAVGMVTALLTAYYMTRQVINGMRDRGFGRIVNISSINGQKGQIGQTNYSAAKAGMIGFTKALALENARKGVTVNCIAPGYIDTEMVGAMDEKVLAGIIAQIPVGRLGKGEEIADMVAFLAGERAGYVTGTTLALNGGQYMVG